MIARAIVKRLLTAQVMVVSSVVIVLCLVAKAQLEEGHRFALVVDVVHVKSERASGSLASFGVGAEAEFYCPTGTKNFHSQVARAMS